MDNVPDFLSADLTVALVVPLALFLAGGLGKKLVRGGKDWQRKDWFLGLDAALAAFTAGILFVFEILADMEKTPTITPDKIVDIIATTSFAALCFVLYLLLLGIHQNWETQDTRVIAQRVWLLGVSNLIGLGLMFLFVLGVKGIG